MKVRYALLLLLLGVAVFAFAQTDDIFSAEVRFQNNISTVPKGHPPGELEGGFKIGNAEFVGNLKENDVTDYKRVNLNGGTFGKFSVQQLNKSGKWLTLGGNYLLFAGHRYTLQFMGTIHGETGQWVDPFRLQLVQDE